MAVVFRLLLSLFGYVRAGSALSISFPCASCFSVCHVPRSFISPPRYQLCGELFVLSPSPLSCVLGCGRRPCGLWGSNSVILRLLPASTFYPPREGLAALATLGRHSCFPRIPFPLTLPTAYLGDHCCGLTSAMPVRVARAGQLLFWWAYAPLRLTHRNIRPSVVCIRIVLLRLLRVPSQLLLGSRHAGPA